MMHWYHPKSANSYLQPAAGGGMGYSVPAAMAAKLASPGRPVLAVCGDGGFAMSIHALMTAVQARIPITVVVFNNNALGWVLHGMGERAVAAGFDEFDHAAIARAAGAATGVRVESVEQLRQALSGVGSRRGPFVIDVPTSLKTSFKDIVQSLAGDRWGEGELTRVRHLGSGSGPDVALDEVDHRAPKASHLSPAPCGRPRRVRPPRACRPRPRKLGRPRRSRRPGELTTECTRR